MTEINLLSGMSLGFQKIGGLNNIQYSRYWADLYASETVFFIYVR
jgi:hypothetical protein